MTLFELALLFSTAGISGVGCAALCNVALERIGRHTTTQAMVATRGMRR
jgi:hypothetical protein